LSNFKSADDIHLDGNIVTGTKHWISMVDRADYGIFRIPVDGTEACILLDFADAKPVIDMTYAAPIGMEVARPGSITLDNYDLPDYAILERRKYQENSKEFFHLSNISDYCFITNYLGLILSLYDDVKVYVEQNKMTGVDFDIRNLGLDISSLTMLWQDNLPTINLTLPTDIFWHRRNTQYTFGKKILIDMISLILRICDSRWLDATSPKNQRFRDALTFCSHMKPLHKNLEEKNFLKN
jgi:hypothetical protein